ncbi:hypothetical protein [Sporosarcina ureilytica]|uniref:Uncharacterized protein n=1 Tax=Sporosarcina ureilytica TaxID=298596 RepID=A0A1D8JG22_9BACL|nr:hypothetical protein [Sporosarcina ureilytica]AOV07658.1 hypothetical protein BI350_08990 [Sporosarcina ureilytica]
MNELKSRLTRELQQDLQVKILHSQYWNLPIHPLKVDFQTVRQTKMDVLMKMLLIAFRESDFKDIDQLSGVLLVEPLFIENIVNKMLRAGLIEKREKTFTLTNKGIDQLKTETFVEQPENCTEKLLYSPCHGKVLQGEPEDFHEQFDEYRLYDQYSDWDVDTLEMSVIQKTLQEMLPVEETPNVQTVIAEINSVAPLAIDFLSCLEFQLYNKEKDIFYARIWNTLLAEWDETLEGQINAHDRQDWREKYKGEI